MLVKDEVTQARHALQNARAAYADRVNAHTADELSRASIMEDGDLAPNNPARQMGRVLTPQQFETQIVAKLGVPNLVFETHPTNPAKRCMFQVRGESKHLVCVYENNPMPEMSIVTGIVKWIPDPDFIGEGAKTIERSPTSAQPVTTAQAHTLVAKHGFGGALAELDKRAADAEPSRAGMKRIVVPGAEKVRGWRTVLVYMMQHGLVSPEQIRGVVAGLDRASWAGYMNGDAQALGEWLK